MFVFFWERNFGNHFGTDMEQEGHDGPGSLTRVSLETHYFKICTLV